MDREVIEMIGIIIKKAAFAVVLHMDGYLKGYSKGYCKGRGYEDATEYLRHIRNEANNVRNFMNDYETFREGIGA